MLRVNLNSNEPTKLGGWMIVILIYSLFSFVMSCSTAVQFMNFSPFLLNSPFDFVGDVNAYRGFIKFQSISTIAHPFLEGVSLFLLLVRSRFYPAVTIFILLATTLYNVVYVFWARTLSIEFVTWYEVILPVIIALTLILYLTRSKRVKNTFMREQKDI